MIRLVLALLALLFALPAVLPEPAAVSVQLAAFVTERGHWLAIPALALVLVPGWRTTRAGTVAAAVALVAAVLLLTPAYRAWRYADELSARVESAFGGFAPRSGPAGEPLEAPFSATTLFTGIESPPIRTTEARIAGATGRLPLRLHHPVGDGVAPGVLLVSGGWWRAVSAEADAGLADYLAARGYVVASVAYGTGASAPHSAAATDIERALRYLHDHAAELRLDDRRLAVVGHGTGGTLALVQAYRGGDRGVRGVAAIQAPTDLALSWRQPGGGGIDQREALAEHLGGTPEQAAGAYAQASPAGAVTRASPPTLLLYGGRDDVVAAVHGERLAERLAGADRPHLLAVLPWGVHGCDLALDGPCGQATLFAVERFLAYALR